MGEIGDANDTVEVAGVRVSIGWKDNSRETDLRLRTLQMLA